MPIIALLEASDVATLVFGCLNTTSMVALSRVSRGLRVVQRRGGLLVTRHNCS